MEIYTINKKAIEQIADEVDTNRAITALKNEMFSLLKTNKKFMKLFSETKEKIRKESDRQYEADLKFRKKNECKICGCYPCMSDCN